MNKRPSFHLLIGLLLCQVAIDLGRSVTAFPFLHYAMYSEVYKKPDSVAFFEIVVNNKVLTSSDYSIYTWGIIHSPLTNVEKQQTANDFSFDKEKMKEGMEAISLRGLYQHVKSNLNNDPTLTQKFPLWYKAYLTRILQYPIYTLKVNKKYYCYKNKRYLLLREENYLTI